jgi:hypothetical protein
MKVAEGLPRCTTGYHGVPLQSVSCQSIYAATSIKLLMVCMDCLAVNEQSNRHRRSTTTAALATEDGGAGRLMEVRMRATDKQMYSSLLFWAGRHVLRHTSCLASYVMSTVSPLKGFALTEMATQSDAKVALAQNGVFRDVTPCGSCKN